jgi:ribosomal protein S18 acetylase RimI-like enzyme
MYELLAAKPEQIDDLVKLVCMTGPYRTAAADNAAGLSCEGFLAHFLVLPRIQHTYVLVDKSHDNRIVGALTCAPLRDIEPTDWSQCSKVSIEGLHDPFRTLQIPDSYYVDTLAVVEDMRGKGLGKHLFLAAKRMANAAGYNDNLSLVVSANDFEAVRLYYSLGLFVTDLVKMKLPGFPPFLLMRKTREFQSYERVCA